MSDHIATRLRAILAEQALVDPEDVRADMTLEDLGIDSMGVVEVIFRIEEELGIDVPYNANEPQKSEFDLTSVGSMTAALAALKARQDA